KRPSAIGGRFLFTARSAQAPVAWGPQGSARIASMGEADPGAARGPAAQDNIFLVGLTGAGKTSIGKLLAKRLDKAVLDSGHEVERATGVKIPVIFEIEGEAGFRARETRMLEDLVRGGNIVLATGGGAVLSPQNRKLLAENGIVVYLRAAVPDLWNR